jgi:cytochrome bd-type quinol oxidase subunit 1
MHSMKDLNMLDKLKADRRLCLVRMKRWTAPCGVLSIAVLLVHVVFQFPPLLNTLALAAGLLLCAAPFGLAYLILGWHIRRMNRD